VSLALPIAFEAQEPDSMRKPPRDPDERLLSRFVVVRTVYVGVLMAAVAITLFLVIGPPLAQAQTLAVTTVAFFQIFYLLMCRTLTAPVRSIGWTSNRYVFAGIAALLVLQAAVVHLPFLQAVFRTDVHRSAVGAGRGGRCGGGSRGRGGEVVAAEGGGWLGLSEWQRIESSANSRSVEPMASITSRALAHRIAGFPAAGHIAVKDRVNAIALAPAEDFRRDQFGGRIPGGSEAPAYKSVASSAR